MRLPALRHSRILVIATLASGPVTPHAQAPAPASSAPTSGAPASGAPTSGAPTSSAPASGAPASGAPAVRAQYHGTTFEGMIPPGKNFDITQFRLWYPDNVSTLRGKLLLTPGSNSDGRASAQDPVWEAFTVQPHLALVACYLNNHFRYICDDQNTLCNFGR